MQNITNVTSSEAAVVSGLSKLEKISRGVALTGAILPLFLIGLLKFTEIEVAALIPLISGTPWLAWLYLVFGEVGTSYLLGIVEMIIALLLIASPWSIRAAIAGGLLASLTFLTTISMMSALPIWEAASGGFPWLSFVGT